MSDKVKLHLGLKSDPIEYRYSYDWLFRILSEEGVRFMQLGTFFELYHLPDHAITSLREKAAQYGVEISSVFTAHRELGGFFINDTAWQEVAFNDYRRLIRVGSLLGARSVGSNPGAVMRDRMETKAAGIRCYVEAMKKLMHYACEQGVETLAIEPMSCLAEPPTLPEEIVSIGEELREYHLANPGSTAQTGYCFDVSHGYVDCSRVMRYSNLDMFEAALPYLTEIHLKNTDANLESTFGFTAKDRARGIVDPGVFRKRLLAGSAQLPSTDLIGYLEIGGPKLGRDYSDAELENQLRESLRYLQKTFACGETSQPEALAEEIRPISVSAPTIKIAPSMMCADMSRLREEIQGLEALGADLLHWDIMDAHFVPNMPCGLVLLEQMRNVTKLPFDVHLMVNNNEFFIGELAKIGVETISVHYESALHLDRALSLIRETGAEAGVALNPSTPPSVLEYVTHLLDFVLVMTVNPGFAGQKLAGSAFAKIADCKSWLSRTGRSIPIEVDGNVSFEHIPQMVAAGADILVAGSSSLFRRGESRNENMRRMRTAIQKGLQTGRHQTEAVPVCRRERK